MDTRAREEIKTKTPLSNCEMEIGCKSLAKYGIATVTSWVRRMQIEDNSRYSFFSRTRPVPFHSIPFYSKRRDTGRSCVTRFNSYYCLGVRFLSCSIPMTIVSLEQYQEIYHSLSDKDSLQPTIERHSRSSALSPPSRPVSHTHHELLILFQLSI